MTDSPDIRRILYVNHQVEFGGAERSLLELMEGLDRQRFQPILACSHEGPLSLAAKALDVQVCFVPMLFQGKVQKLMGLIRAARLLKRLIKDLRIQLVHTNSMIAGYCGSMAARRAKVPCVWHARDMEYPAPARRLCRLAQCVIANSQATAQNLGLLDNAVDCRIIYNGVADRFFQQADSRDEVRHELHLAANENLVGIFSRLDPWKGHKMFMDAAKQILSKKPDTSFVVVGGQLFPDAEQRHGNYPAELQNYARELGIYGRVHFLGPREDVPRLMASMDVVVHPSQEPEPFGRSIIEAQAVGTPVVASDLGGIPEIIEDESNGLLFPSFNTSDLASQVLRLLEDPQLAQILGQAGKMNAQDRFSQAQNAQAVAAVYERLLA